MAAPEPPSEADTVRLRHMLDSGRQARAFLDGRRKREFRTDRMLRNAVVREIEILGEAASRVSPRCRRSLPGIRWRGIIGMRNRLIHAYFDVDADRVWDTVRLNVPPLIDELERILRTA